MSDAATAYVDAYVEQHLAPLRALAAKFPNYDVMGATVDEAYLRALRGLAAMAYLQDHEADALWLIADALASRRAAAPAS